MNEKQFEELVERLDLIMRLLAITTLEGKTSQKDKILELSSLGFAPTSIAKLLGTTVNTVNVTLSKARKEGKRNQRGKVKAHDQHKDLQVAS